jgi:hypothetical protein
VSESVVKLVLMYSFGSESIRKLKPAFAVLAACLGDIAHSKGGPRQMDITGSGGTLDFHVRYFRRHYCDCVQINTRILCFHLDFNLKDAGHVNLFYTFQIVCFGNKVWQRDPGTVGNRDSK